MMQWSYDTLLKWGTDELTAHDVENASLDAWYLLEYIYGISRVDFLMRRSNSFDPAQMEKSTAYQALIRQRSEGCPVQYLTGSTEFMGLPFFVNEHVLIPRQDTETLVERVLQEQKDPDIRLLDLCTGSGCIAISLAVMGGYRDVTAADLSEAALKVAAENADHLLQERRKEGCRFTLRRGDLFEALKPGERFDVLTSNPPYIPTEVVRGLEPEVKDHEPWMALDGTEDGLAFYRRIVHESKAWLNPGACIYLEIGYDQGEAVSRLLEAAGFCNIQVIKDLPGLDRVVRAEIKK